jgi:hypothetical protein
MLTIWKYPLTLMENQVVQVPRYGRPIHVHEQGGEVCAWVLVDDSNPKVDYVFSVYGTGHPIPDSPATSVYVGSAHVGPFVWHVFDRGEVIQ